MAARCRFDDRGHTRINADELDAGYLGGRIGGGWIDRRSHVQKRLTVMRLLLLAAALYWVWYNSDAETQKRLDAQAPKTEAQQTELEKQIEEARRMYEALRRQREILRQSQ